MNLPIIDLYSKAFSHLYFDNNKPQARRDFYNGVYLYTDQADFYRGLIAAKDTTDYLTPVQLDDLFNLRHSFGMLSMAIGQPSALPSLTYQTPFAEFVFDITSRTRLHAAQSMRLASVGLFEKSNLALVECPDLDHPYIKLAYAYLNFKSGRWADAFEESKNILRVPLTSSVDDKPAVQDNKVVQDRELHYMGRFMMGVSLAHLGYSKEARDHLYVSIKSHNIALVSESYMWLGLISRMDSDLDAAMKLLKKGKGIYSTPEIVEAINNPMRLIPITTVETINKRTSYWDVSTQPEYEPLRENETQEMRELLKTSEKELSQQIGMVDVKRSIRTMKDEILFDQQKEKRGIPVTTPTRHLVLSGPPGTGKTTIARIIAKIYAGYGITRTPNIIEASRSDLVGADEGATAAMTTEVINRAKGGILFIDEAPDMIQDRKGQADYRGQESINVILQEMENNRKDLIVIIAGYENQLNRFLATNPGLRSRFSNWIKFDTYSPEEIADIAELIATQGGNSLDSDAKKEIVKMVSSIQTTDHHGVKLIDKLGNGRFARNLIEYAERNRLKRLSGFDFDKVGTSTLMRLTKSDISEAGKSLINTVL